jgi:tetratricopeptide (TPR) repeat protein
VAVPLPRLDGIEPLVSSQIREELQAFADRTAGRPSDAELGRAYGSLARLFHVYELFEAAEAAYANAVRLARGEVEWLHLLGYLYEQTGRLEEAAETFGAVRFAGPRGNASAIRLADVLLRLNRLRDAREQFQSLVATFPAIAQNGLGEVALREGRFAEAIAHFRAALGRVPQATSLHYSLAMAYRGLGKLEEARAHLDQRGSGGIRIGDPIVERLQTLVRGERGLVLQGRRAYDEGRFEDAAAAFRDALDAAPDSVGARANLGLALSQLGDEAGAAEQFEAVLRLDAGNVIAHASLGTLLVRQRRDTEAVDHLRAAFEQTPRDPNLRRQLVGALLRLGQPARAIDALERARSFSPDDEDLVVGLAILLADQQRYADAVARLDAAYQRFPERTATATTLARLLASAPDLALRNGERALTLATAVYESDPAAAHAETVAMSLAELGRCDEAAAWMRRAVTQAERAKDAPELARLKGEMLRYGSACRR